MAAPSEELEIALTDANILLVLDGIINPKVDT